MRTKGLEDLVGGRGCAEPIMGCWANDVDKYAPGFATEYLHTWTTFAFPAPFLVLVTNIIFIYISTNE